MDAKTKNENTSITTHLEGFLESARQLECALAEERARGQKIAQDYLATRKTLEGAVRDLQSRLLQRENKIQALVEALKTAQANDERAKKEIVSLSEREKKSAAALAQYQSAWTEVLAREAQARNLLVEHEKARRAIAEKDARLRELEEAIGRETRKAAEHCRHSETYQRELQSALIRIQSAESKHAQIRKEMETLAMAKRNVDQEIARIEAASKARVDREIAAEKERIVAETERVAREELQRIRVSIESESRAAARAAEKAAAESRAALESELSDARAALVESENARKAETERSRSRFLSMNEDLERAKQAVRTVVESKATEVGALVERLEESEKMSDALRAENAMLKLESARAQAALESARKEATKSLLVERLRFESRVSELHGKIEALMNDGIYAEAIEAVPEGEVAVAAIESASAIRPVSEGASIPSA